MLTTSPGVRRLLALCLVPLLLLTGCVKLSADVAIKDENSIHLKMVIGVSKQLMSMSGTSSSTMQDDCSGSSNDKTMTAKQFDDGSYVGCEIEGTAAAKDFKGTKDMPFRVEFDKDHVTFTMNNGFLNDAAESSDRQLSASMLSDFKVSVSFPGEVIEHSGSSEVSGRTVTWTSASDLFSADGLRAVSKRGFSIPVWVWPLVGVLVVGVIAAGVVLGLRRRRSAAAATDPDGVAATTWDPNEGQPGSSWPGGPQGPQPQQPQQPWQPGGASAAGMAGRPDGRPGQWPAGPQNTYPAGTGQTWNPNGAEYQSGSRDPWDPGYPSAGQNDGGNPGGPNSGSQGPQGPAPSDDDFWRGPSR